jgi:hypothetical protein
MLFFLNKYASFLLFFKQFCAFFVIYYALKSEPYILPIHISDKRGDKDFWSRLSHSKVYMRHKNNFFSLNEACISLYFRHWLNDFNYNSLKVKFLYPYWIKLLKMLTHYLQLKKCLQKVNKFKSIHVYNRVIFYGINFFVSDFYYFN